MEKGLKRTLGNQVMILLDPDNDSIKTKSGAEFYIDTSYDPEKHATVTGTVVGLPNNLVRSLMPWGTDMELQEGDKVVFHYQAYLNALSKEMNKSIVEGDDHYIFVKYDSIFVAVRDGKIIPVNGYVLVERADDPYKKAIKDRLEQSNIELVTLKEKSNTDVTFGIVRYVGTPIKEYDQDVFSDNGVNLSIDGTVIMRRITDVPVEYEYHAKLDSGKKFFRVQRRNIIATL